MSKGPTIEQIASKPSEHMQQTALFMWRNRVLWIHPELKWMHAIPNGGWRDKRTASRLKLEGLTSGIHDVFLPYPSNGYHGLYIEMKKSNGVPSDVTKEQRDFMEWILSVGYFGKICFGYCEARDTVLQYIRKTQTQTH